MSIEQKRFNNHDKDSTNSSISYIFFISNFTFKAFNQLFHNPEISKLLIASLLFDLFDHYSTKANPKIINIAHLLTKFSLLLNG